MLKVDGTYDLLWDALEIIVEANEKKPLDKTSGKVIKGGDYVDPIGLIKELVRGGRG